jgi:hypothetical protein
MRLFETQVDNSIKSVKLPDKNYNCCEQSKRRWGWKHFTEIVEKTTIEKWDTMRFFFKFDIIRESETRLV